MKDFLRTHWLSTLMFCCAAAILFAMFGCTRTIYVPVTAPDPVVSPSPGPVATTTCRSVPRSQGDCYRTDADLYLAQVEAAHDAAKADKTLVEGDWILGGTRYLDFIKKYLRDSKGLCAEIYHEEEMAVWLDGAAFSENWDLIAEPGDGSLLPRRGSGAHGWSCRPPTTEHGSN